MSGSDISVLVMTLLLGGAFWIAHNRGRRRSLEATRAETDEAQQGREALD